jgi:biopolymer transport protein ExbB/TolQ
MLLIFSGAGLLTTAFYAALTTYLPPESIIVRYCTSHPVEYTEILMFFTGVMALAVKAWGLLGQRKALRTELLPAIRDQRVPASDAGKLADVIARLPRQLQNTLLARRLTGALEFVHQRNTPEGLDEHLRSQADTDAEALEGSYGLIRFITWAIPILGFLGTVLGITAAIANITPEEAVNSIASVTNGLALAFDATALALGCAMGLMFLNYLVERGEQNLLLTVNARAETELLHRFERLDTDGGEYVGILREQGRLLLQSTEKLVVRQAEVWTKSLEEMNGRLDSIEKSQRERLTAGLEKLLERTLSTHQERLLSMEKRLTDETSRLLQQFERIGGALSQTTGAMNAQAQRAAEQATLLSQLLESEQQIQRLQTTLSQNLQTLSHSGAFEQALHSLTAAIHLLTARAETPAAYGVGSARGRQGNAA